MKKILLMLVLLPLMAWANKEVVNGIEWTYTIQDGEAVIESKSSYYYYAYYYAAIPSTTTGVVSIPSTLGGCPVTSIGESAFEGRRGITSIIIPPSIQSIGRYAFESCTGLTAIVIPDNVTEIGSGAFNGCNNLSEMTLPITRSIRELFGWSVPASLQSVRVTKASALPSQAFQECENLRSVTLPAGVSSIGSSAFEGCRSLQEIVIPAGVTNIGCYAFEDCETLKQVVIPAGVIRIEGGAFADCKSLERVTLPTGLTEIGSSAFEGCHTLSSINIPTTVSKIGQGAFDGCRALGTGVVIVDNCLLMAGDDCPSSVQIPNTVRLIVSAAFSRCWNLRSVTLPSGLETVPFGLFEDCRNLASVNLPKGVVDIESYAFHGCSALSSVTLPNGLEVIGDYAFGDCPRLISVTFPQSVRMIGEGAFQYCSGLTSITLSDGLQTIGRESFYGTRLKEVLIPASVGEIGRRAFQSSEVETFRVDTRNPNYKSVDGCLLSKDGRKLICGKTCEEVKIPDGVETICDYAFYGCQKLKSVSIPASVQTISRLAFGSCRQIENVDIPDIAKWCDYSFGGVPHLRLKGEEIVDLVIPEGVTSVVSQAFAGCAGLRSVSIPASLKKIGDSAFKGCVSLSDVEIEDLSLWCEMEFDNYESNPFSLGKVLKQSGEIVRDLIIPQGVTSIVSRAFAGCESITSVYLPESLVKIGYGAFKGCKSISSVYATSIDSWLQIYFADRYSNPCANGARLYFDRGSSWAIRIPEGCSGIGSYAFVGCENIERIILPESVSSVPRSAFDGCTSLIAFEVADANPYYCAVNDVLYNRNQMFFVFPPGKTGVMTIPTSVTWISQGELESCSKLTALAVETGHPTYYALNGCLYSRSNDALVAVPGGLEQLVLPENLSRIDAPLSLCKNLRTVRFSAGTARIPERAFENCRNLQEVSIPYGVTRIGYSAFAGCESLTSIVIPNSVVEIGESSFRGCNSLQEMTLPFAGTTPTTEFCRLFSYSASDVPASLQTVRITNATVVPDYAFRNCVNIRAISLPIGVSVIGSSAFSGCRALQEIALPAGVAKIGYSAFAECESLRNVVIPAGVTQIESSTFRECQSLERVTLPAGLLRIDYCAFASCRRLSVINIPTTVSEIGVGAFWGCSSLGSGVVIVDNCLLNANDGYPADVRILDSVRLIAGGAFSECENLRSLVLPKGLRVIPESLCEDCKGLKSVSIPASVREIGDYAFEGCYSLESITLPEGVRSLGWGAFDGCASIRSFHVPATLVNMSIGDADGWTMPSYYCDWDDWDDETIMPSRLTKVTVAAGNPRYAASDGLLYTKDYKALLWCPQGLASVKIKPGTQYINSDAFDDCSLLQEVAIPAGVKHMAGGMWWDDEENCWSWDDGGEAFYGCSALRKVSLPASLEDVDLSDELPSLTTLTVDSANKTYLSYSNALYERKGARLVYCAPGVSSVTLWNKTEIIGSRAFEGCEKIKSLIVPATVKWIGTSPFYGCTNLRKIEYKGNAPWTWGGLGCNPIPRLRESCDGDYSLLAAEDLSEIEEYWGLYRIGWWSSGSSCEDNSSPAFVEVTSYATPGTKGWPTWGDWQGRPLVFGSPAQGPVAQDPVLNATFDGYVLSESSLVALVQLKTTAKGVVTATVTDRTGMKWSYAKGTVQSDGSVEGLVCTAKDCPVPALDVELNGNKMSGSWGDKRILGARNGMGVKGDAMMAGLETYKGKWSLTVDLDGAARLESAPDRVRLMLDVGAKGVVKVSGNWEVGTKVSVSAQLVMGESFACVPVLVTAKNVPPLRLIVRLMPTGEVELVSGGELVAGGRTVAELGEAAFAASAVSAGGKAFRAQVTVDELAYPAKFAAKGLPAGLKIDAATGVISGTPTKPGRYTVVVTVTSGLNSKVKVEKTVEIEVANFTDALIPVQDVYGPYYVGVAAQELVLAAEGCTVSGLPAGLKWTAKDIVDSKTKEVTMPANAVYGVPTKAVTNTVYFKKSVKEVVDGKQKSVAHQASATFIVEGLRPWAAGTFDSIGDLPATVTVAENGKVSGKLVSDGLTWTLAAPSYASFDPAAQIYAAEVSAKSGKELRTLPIEVSPAEGGYGVLTTDLDFTAVQNLWKTEPWKTEGKVWAKRPPAVFTSATAAGLLPGETVTLKFAASGAVSAAGVFSNGYKATCSTVLVPYDGAPVAFISFPANEKKGFRGYSACLAIRGE